jgi:hypothetical protein
MRDCAAIDDQSIDAFARLTNDKVDTGTLDMEYGTALHSFHSRTGERSSKEFVSSVSSAAMMPPWCR